MREINLSKLISATEWILNSLGFYSLHNQSKTNKPRVRMPVSSTFAYASFMLRISSGLNTGIHANGSHMAGRCVERMTE